MGPDFSNEGGVHGVAQGTPLADPCQAEGGVRDRAGARQVRLQKLFYLQAGDEEEPLTVVIRDCMCSFEVPPVCQAMWAEAVTDRSHGYVPTKMKVVSQQSVSLVGKSEGLDKKLLAVQVVICGAEMVKQCSLTAGQMPGSVHGPNKPDIAFVKVQEPV